MVSPVMVVMGGGRARTFASSVFPVPGGPTSKAPFGILAPRSLYLWEVERASMRPVWGDARCDGVTGRTTQILHQGCALNPIMDIKIIVSLVVRSCMSPSCAPRVAHLSGFLRKSTNSMISSLASSHPATSLNMILSFAI